MDNSEQFLKANARKDYILSEFNEVLRDLIRATSALNDYQSGVYRAAKQMGFVMELIERCEEPITWGELFTYSVEHLRGYERGDWVDQHMMLTARAGMSMLAEATCLDGAAKGRFGGKLHSFLSMMESLEKMRDERGRETRAAFFGEQTKIRKTRRNSSIGATKPTRA